MTEPKAASSAGKPKSRKSLIFIVLAIVLAAGGGAGAFWKLRKATPSTGEAAHASAVEHGAVAFDPFVVNLADTSASRFLRVTIQLLVADPATAAHVKENEVGVMQARSAILELLTLQTSDRLATPAGKTELKKAIVERMFTVMDGLKVIDVLFSDFVIQF
jgi:flagellar FliL protein